MNRTFSFSESSYGPLCLMLTGKLVDMGWSAFSGPVKKYVDVFAQKVPDNRPRRVNKSSDGVATGVAIGYFHNFLKPLDGAIAYERLIVFASESKKQASGLTFTAFTPSSSSSGGALDPPHRLVRQPVERGRRTVRGAPPSCPRSCCG